jgi:hypothetical protein
MTTQAHTQVDVDADGLVKACAWCCTRAQLVALNRAYPAKVSHGLCPACAQKMEKEAA